MKMVIFFLFSIFILLLKMYKNANKVMITNEIISMPYLIEKKRILFITDIHYRKINPDSFALLPPVDFVIIGGDLVELGVDDAVVDGNLSILSEMGKAFFVWGNNDYEYGEKRLHQLLVKHNIFQLNNSSHTIKDNYHSWTIAGVEDLGYDRADVNKSLKMIKTPTILVSHNPEVAFYLQKKHTQVIALLSGHTHGGQIRLGPFSLGERGGWKKKNDYPVFISNGYGTTRLPFRLGAPPQLHLISVE